MDADRAKRFALLGDSIFDNGKYVPAGQSVPELLQVELGPDWIIENLAVDGNTVNLVDPGVLRDERFDPESTLVALNVGGNDAIWNVDLLADPTPRPAVESIARLQQAVVQFAGRYEGLVASIVDDLQLQLIGCTIYQPVMDEFPAEATAGALAMFNDAIVRTLKRHGLDWLELRDICYEPGHFTNVIEPSSIGGRRIALALKRAALSSFAT